MTRVLFLAAEADPLVKVGGLGDVAGSLPRALQGLSAGGPAVEVRLALPFHPAIREKAGKAELLFDFEVPYGGGRAPAQAFHLQLNGVETYLISGEPVEQAPAVYSSDAAGDGQKYVFFSLAALELARKLDWRPDILHANDWHTALAVYALKLRRPEDPFFKDTRSVLTVHNLPFMGAGTEAAFDLSGLPPSRYPRMPGWARKFPLPLGLQSADRIVAVSPTYAREVLTPEYGCGLEGLLLARQHALSGILNGIDQDLWDPAQDPNIRVNYDSETLAWRQANKQALAEEFSLDPDPQVPLLVLISRMDPQKGVDLAVEGLSLAKEARWQAILLGTGDAELEAACRRLEKELPERVRAVIRFDARLSRRMYAGGDILLIPSRYEPCGLAQMMAMRYGCVPLARATGGLRDTVLDSESAGEEATGFLFQPATPQALAAALKRALETFRDPKRWQELQKTGMRRDFSWKRSAREYLDLYREIQGKAAAGNE